MIRFIEVCQHYFYMYRLSLILAAVLFAGHLQAATHHPGEFLSEIKGSPDEGALIVQHFCAVCHAEHPQIAVGAPRVGYFEDWRARLKQGFASLVRHTDEGLNAMPPRGGCFECTDEQLSLAINSLIGERAQAYIKELEKTD